MAYSPFTFEKFRDLVNARFNTMVEAGYTIYQSAMIKDVVWDLYLEKATQQQLNSKFRERGHLDCNCCKRFIRNVGRVLFSVDGKLVSIWDDLEATDGYEVIAEALAKANRKAGVAGIYLNDEEVVGRKQSFERLEDGTVHTWNHFEVVLPQKAFSLRGDVAERKSEVQNKTKGLRNSLKKLTMDSVLTVIELCEENLILRSSQQLPIVKGFKATMEEYEKVEDKELYVWDKTAELVSKDFEPNVRGTSIGSLLKDLSEGTPLEDAVKKYEDKVNGGNYMRKTPIFSKRQKEDAMNTAKSEGFEPSFYRRHAVKEDISVNDVLFADGEVQEFMQDSPFDMLEPTKKATPQNFDKVKEVGIEEFISQVLPKAQGLELYLENKHESNLVTLVSAVNPDAPNILRWGNNTSWDYNGGYADSVIAQRVASKGGNINAAIRVSAAWEHRDDLDLHMKNSVNEHVYYGSYCYGSVSSDSFQLDVDMRGEKFEQVENIICPDPSKLKKNTRLPIWIHNFDRNSARSSDPTRVEGFKIEVAIFDEVHTVEYTKRISQGEKVEVGHLVVDGQGNVTFEPALACKSTTNPRKLWNVMSCEFVPVDMVMRSPNFWESADKGGNEHVFFMLRDCKNPDKVRGFYNEYLVNSLRKHRSVFEMLGELMSVDYSEDQLSGVGFSKSQRNSVVLRVKGETQRVYKVKF